MPGIFELTGQEELEEFRRDLSDVDINHVVDETLKATVSDIFEAIRTSIRLSDEFDSPASLQSEYYGDSQVAADDGEYGEGPFKPPGPPLSQENAWRVEDVPDGKIVRPRKNVHDRARIMEIGRPPIRTDPFSPMRFYVEGVPVFTQEVAGVEPSNFFTRAMRFIDGDNTFEKNANRLLNAEFERKLNSPTGAKYK